jgi:tetratricopeptide (TPR) repeat protein
VVSRARFSLWVVLATTAATMVSPPAAEARRKKRRHSHVVAAIEAAPTAEPPLQPDAARAYQASYDHETAGRFADALRDLGELPPDEQESYLGRLRRGWLLYRAGRHSESVTSYRLAIALEHSSVEARVGGLLPLIALRQWPEVEQSARAALDLDPANYLAGVRLAFAVYNRGRYPEAEALYRRVLARYPSDADARAGLGWSLLKQGKRADARQAFLAASRTAPRSPTVVEGLAAAGR